MHTLPPLSRVLMNVAPNSQRAVLHLIARQIALDLSRHPAGIDELFQSSNELMQTSTQGGVMVMDACVDGLDEPYLLLARLAHPINAKAADRRNVDLIAVLLSPSHDRVAHIRATGRVTRFVRDQVFAAGWRGANSADSVRALFTMPVNSVLEAA